MKKKTKKILFLTIGISLFVIFLFSLIYFGFLQSIIGSDCSFGSWSSSYDSSSDIYTITGSIPLSRRGADASCFAPPDSDTINCINITDKLVTSTGHCKIYDDWTGSLVLKHEYDINNDLSFDGCRVSFPYAGEWKQRECSFEIKVSPKVIEQPVAYYRFFDNTCTEVSILSSERTENDYLTSSECENNIIPPIPWLLYIAIGTIGVFIISLVVYFLRKKHKRR